MTIATLTQPQEAVNARLSDEAHAMSEVAMNLMQTEIDFIPNAEFNANDGELDETVTALLNTGERSGKAPSDLPAHLRRICEADLLTHEQESALFREMNYLKFRANSLRSQLDPENANSQTVTEIQDALSRAQAIRDHIIKANMRLVMSIVKKFVTPQQSFDDMLSEGTFTLMQAVEKFDFDRGFRFSTYAYRSIARNAYRSVTTANKEEARYTRDAEEWAFEADSDHSSSTTTEQIWTNLRELTSSMLEKLDRRERFIIRSRYALGAHRKVRTFQCLADKLGVSKERVRQLEQRAVNKLRAMAGELEVDELFGASMV